MLKRPTTLLFAAALASSGCKADPQVVGEVAPDHQEPVGQVIETTPERLPVPPPTPVGTTPKHPQPVGRPAKVDGKPTQPIRSPSPKIGKSVQRPPTKQPRGAPIPKPPEPLVEP